MAEPLTYSDLNWTEADGWVARGRLPRAWAEDPFAFVGSEQVIEVMGVEVTIDILLVTIGRDPGWTGQEAKVHRAQVTVKEGE